MSMTHVACTLTCRREMLHMPFSLRLTAYAFVPLALPLINSQRVESAIRQYGSRYVIERLVIVLLDAATMVDGLPCAKCQNHHAQTVTEVWRMYSGTWERCWRGGLRPIACWKPSHFPAHGPRLVHMQTLVTCLSHVRLWSHSELKGATRHQIAVLELHTDHRRAVPRQSTHVDVLARLVDSADSERLRCTRYGDTGPSVQR
jgi:hypothetical protein